jgi:2-phospho-L-lactate guanylyltransferase
LTSSDPTALWAVVPVKDLADAKQRLKPVLTPLQRRGLYEAMLTDVLSALANVDRLAGTLVITADVQVTALVERFGVRVLHENVNRGHSAAVSFAARELAGSSVATMLQVPGDTPLLTSADIDHLIDRHLRGDGARGGAVTVTPSLDEQGTNAILCTPPDVIPFRFGPDSFRLHLEGARCLGIEPLVVERAGAALDIDEADDLYRFIANPTPTHAYAYLSAAGIVDTLKQRQIHDANVERSKGNTRSA